ncbi:MAG TPA: HDIG domain-containing protein [bacterium]|nr:HDIG domain-containing protein [bacterium]
MNKNGDKPGKLAALEIQSQGKRSWQKLLMAQYRLRPVAITWIINVITGVIIMFIISQPEAPTAQKVYVPSIKEGEPVIAVRDLEIKKDLEVPDVEGTEKKRGEAAAKTPAIYDWDPLLLKDKKKTISSFFEGFRELYPPPPDVPPGETPSPDAAPITVPETFMPEKEQKLLKDFGVSLTKEEMELLKQRYFMPELENALISLIESVYAGKDQNFTYIVANKDLVLKDRDRGIRARSIAARPEDPMIPITNFDAITDITGCQARIDQLAPEKLKDIKAPRQALLKKLALALIEPNLTFNKNKTEEVRTAAVDAIKPLYYKFKKGEVVVRKGDRLSPDAIKKIDAILLAQQTRGAPALRRAGMFVITLFFIASMVTFASRNIKKFRPDPKDLVFLASVLVISLAVLKGIDLLSRVSRDSFAGLPEDVNFYYLIPLAGAAMLVRMVLNSEIALVFSIALAIFGAMVADNSILFGLYTMIGSVAAAGEVRQCRQRSTIIRAGLALGIVNVLLIFTISFITRQLTADNAAVLDAGLIYNCAFGLAGSVFISIMITGLVPVAESLFSYSTDIKLLELLNQDHPVLKDLSMRAPGTHLHSLMVANLAEAAAKAINANPLLARVSAIYHDIGKMNKPLYFAENQWDGNNVHERLAPSMSTLIIHNHVKEGVELAERYKLPRVVTDAIRQHHGQSLLKFFYEKAKELNDTGRPVEETEFRYPGPKPQTRENAIILLADVVESAARTVRDPNPARLQGMVQKLINRFFTDGQLDECDLTLKNLHDIARSFNLTLGAIYHQRPDYQEPVVKGAPDKKKKADQDAAKPKDKRDDKAGGEEEDAKESENYLKRLGM